MRIWRAMLVAGVAWMGMGSGLRAEDVAAPPSDAFANDDGAPAKSDSLPAEGSGQTAGTPSPKAPAADPKIDALIKQLGANEFDDRETAVAELKEIGEPALPALRKALESDNAEAASRADVVLRELRRPPQAARLPTPRRGQNFGFVGGGEVHIKLAVQNGNRQINVVEPGRKINIVENPGGIEMAITGEIDGKEVTRNFQARTPDELRRQNPEAFELYERFAGRGAVLRGGVGDPRLIMPGRAFVRRNVPGMPGGVRIVPPQRIRGPEQIGGPEQPGDADPFQALDEMAELRELIQRQMQEADMPPGQRREMAGMLDRLREARGANDPLADRARFQRDMQALNQRADPLPERVNDLQRPEHDAARALPPGTGLPIEVVDEPEVGVTVLRVIPKGRAQQLGLEPLDVITKVNGKAVRNSQELRRAVADAKAPLVVEGTRDGEPLKLEEKIDATERPTALRSAKPPAAD